MVNPTRKRVRAPRRAPDGSAFESCQNCGVLVAVALADMHECESKREQVMKKRFKCELLLESKINERQKFDDCFKDQPRSAFRFFMEIFGETCEAKNQIEIERKGYDTWRNMSKQERLPYVLQAEKVNSEYERALFQEVEDMLWINDEADSADVGRYDKRYDDCLHSDDSGIFESFHSETNYSFNSEDWLRVHPRVIYGAPCLKV